MERRVIHIPVLSETLHWTAEKVLGAGADIAMAPINALASGLADATGDMLASLGTIWIRLNVPNIWTGGTTSSTVQYLHSQVAYLVGFLAVLGIMIGAVRLAVTQRAQPGVDLVQGLFILVIVTGCGVPVIALLVGAADEWSQAIIANALHGGDFGRNVAEMLKLSGPQLAPILAILFGLVAVFVSGLMICALAFRAAMLVLLAGLLPVAAAMTTTQTGRMMMKKYAAWVISLVAWKPCAALIYAAAFRLMGARELDASGVGSILIGLTLMTAAVLALPALLKFLVPAAAVLHTGSPAAASRTAAMQIPAGARMIRHAVPGPSAAVAAAGGRMAAGARNAPPGPSGPSGRDGPPGSGPPPPVPPVQRAPVPAQRP
jgi:type IV secretion system protein TrbL